MDSQSVDTSVQYVVLFRGIKMSPISEAELKKLAVESPTPISRFEIMETEDGLGWWYLKVIVDSGKRGKPKDSFILTSARKSARRWGDLNNTIGWIRKLNVPSAEVVVKLNWPGDGPE